jgi:hypothetical protein
MSLSHALDRASPLALFSVSSSIALLGVAQGGLDMRMSEALANGCEAYSSCAIAVAWLWRSWWRVQSTPAAAQ